MQLRRTVLSSWTSPGVFFLLLLCGASCLAEDLPRGHVGDALYLFDWNGGFVSLLMAQRQVAGLWSLEELAGFEGLIPKGARLDGPRLWDSEHDPDSGVLFFVLSQEARTVGDDTDQTFFVLAVDDLDLKPLANYQLPARVGNPPELFFDSGRELLLVLWGFRVEGEIGGDRVMSQQLDELDPETLKLRRRLHWKAEVDASGRMASGEFLTIPRFSGGNTFSCPKGNEIHFWQAGTVRVSGASVQAEGPPMAEIFGEEVISRIRALNSLAPSASLDTGVWPQIVSTSGTRSLVQSSDPRSPRSPVLLFSVDNHSGARGEFLELPSSVAGLLPSGDRALVRELSPGEGSGRDAVATGLLREYDSVSWRLLREFKVPELRGSLRFREFLCESPDRSTWIFNGDSLGILFLDLETGEVTSTGVRFAATPANFDGLHRPMYDCNFVRTKRKESEP